MVAQRGERGPMPEDEFAAPPRRSPEAEPAGSSRGDRSTAGQTLPLWRRLGPTACASAARPRRRGAAAPERCTGAPAEASQAVAAPTPRLEPRAGLWLRALAAAPRRGLSQGDAAVHGPSRPLDLLAPGLGRPRWSGWPRRWRATTGLVLSLAVSLALSLALGLALPGPAGAAGMAAETRRAFTLYAKGDMTAAARLLLPLAEAGDARAQALLGYLYERGQGVGQDFPRAAWWYGCAAEQGDATAQYLLGLAYDKGQGVARDVVLAQKWLILAAARAERSQRDAYTRIRNSVATKMSRAQIALAQQLAQNWVPIRQP